MFVFIHSSPSDSHRFWIGHIPLFYSSEISFQASLRQPKWRSYANFTPQGSSHTKLPLRHPQNYQRFILQHLLQGFIPSILYVKKDFFLFVILTWKMHIAVTSLLRDKQPPLKWVLLFFNFYSFCNFTLVIERKLIVSLCFFHISVCIISSSHKSGSTMYKVSNVNTYICTFNNESK